MLAGRVNIDMKAQTELQNDEGNAVITGGLATAQRFTDIELFKGLRRLL